jgi:hypothetical protein
MSLIKDRARFNNRGGGLLKSKVIASGGAFTSLDDLGYLDESGLGIDPKIVQWDDERGFVINALPGGEEWRLTTTLMQSGADEIALARSSPSEYRHWYYQAKLANGSYQEIYIPLGKIVSKLDLGFKKDKRLIKLEILALMPKGIVTVTPAGLSVPADAYGVIVETAVAPLGEVTTPSGTIYTAAV